MAAIRPYKSSDFRSVVDLLQTALPAERIDGPKFVHQVLLDPNFKPEGALVAEQAGEPIGFALAMSRQVPIEGSMPDRERGYLTLFAVQDGHRHKGIGADLLDQAVMEQRLAGFELHWSGSS